MVTAFIKIGNRAFLFDAESFELENYTQGDLVEAMRATLEIFLADVARGGIEHWYLEEVKND